MPERSRNHGNLQILAWQSRDQVTLPSDLVASTFASSCARKSETQLCPRIMLFFSGDFRTLAPLSQGSLNYPFWGDQTWCKCIVILRDFPYNKCFVWVGNIMTPVSAQMNWSFFSALPKPFWWSLGHPNILYNKFVFPQICITIIYTCLVVLYLKITLIGYYWIVIEESL